MMKSRSVSRDLVDVLPGVVGDDRVERLAHPDDLLGLDLDVDRLAGRTAVRLVDEHPGVRQHEALTGRARGEDHRGGRGGLAEADGAHLALHELHGVVDREEAGDLATRRVDVDRDVLVGILALQVEELRDHDVGDHVVDRGAEEDDAVLQQAVEDGARPGATRSAP